MQGRPRQRRFAVAAGTQAPYLRGRPEDQNHTFIGEPAGRD